MGEAYSCRCKKCGEQYTVYIGPTMYSFQMSVDDELFDSILKSEIGTKLKENGIEQDHLIKSESSEVYYCEKCGNWENVIAYEVRCMYIKDFEVKSTHICNKCGSILIPATIENLKCKNCYNILYDWSLSRLYD